MSSLPSFAQAWLRQREAGARAVAEIERIELRRLTDAESGFVEQQRLFARAR